MFVGADIETPLTWSPAASGSYRFFFGFFCSFFIDLPFDMRCLLDASRTGET
jgi:hypothetical protein